MHRYYIIAFNINYDDAYIFVFLIFLMAILFSKQKTKISRLTISFKFLILYKIVGIIVMLPKLELHVLMIKVN